METIPTTATMIRGSIDRKSFIDEDVFEPLLNVQQFHLPLHIVI